MIKKICLVAALTGAICYAACQPNHCSAEAAPAAPAPPPPAPAPPAQMDNETAAALTPIIIERYIYESSGRKDPFLSLVEIKKKKMSAAPAEKANKPPRAVSPLEIPELRAIVLKGIIIDAKKKYAVVEVDGKTFVIYERMYLGREGGRVVKINSDNLIVELIMYDENDVENKSYHSLRLRKEGQD
ncbi:pilus assembly protein PilP [Candidatus Magnetominusculus xianensis]|nr:pilus assembly protein PilP [Candidatus Magnetominusculus xianensis]MBF0404365.1 pilus assembly protein PilP [Nitrospirota bacterium]